MKTKNRLIPNNLTLYGTKGTVEQLVTGKWRQKVPYFRCDFWTIYNEWEVLWEAAVNHKLQNKFENRYI